jgi:hypothetical protein
LKHSSDIHPLLCSCVVLIACGYETYLDKLKVADHDRLAEALAYALRHYFGKKIARGADGFMVGIVAKRLTELSASSL